MMGLRPLMVCVVIAAFGLAGCPGTDGTGADAGGEDAGRTVAEGTVTCAAGHDCAAGTHCDGDTCAPGCFLDASCRDDEFCWGVTETTTGQCRLRTAPTCGDGICDVGEGPDNCGIDCVNCDHVGGPSACGAETCPSGEFCSDPASGTCAAGCTSQSHCGCGLTCTIPTAIDVGSCIDPYGNPNLCGNDTCDAGETLQDCPEDCQDWAVQCTFACDLLSDAECFEQDADAFACYQRCDTGDETQQEAFSACVGNAIAPCPLNCLAELPE